MCHHYQERIISVLETTLHYSCFLLYAHDLYVHPENRDDITTPDDLIKQVDKLDTIYGNIIASKEAAIDSEGIRLLSAIGREQVETTHGELIQFDTATYAEKLVTHMGGRRGDGGTANLDWEKLGDRAMRCFRKAPAVNFL